MTLERPLVASGAAAGMVAGFDELSHTLRTNVIDALALDAALREPGGR